MKPIYFPFTFISETVLKNVRVFFPHTTIYQPSSDNIPELLQKSADEGFLELRAPFGGDEKRFDMLVREYKYWLAQHKGSEITFAKDNAFDGVDLETAPMFSDSSTSQIKFQIKKGFRDDQSFKPDPVFTARLFLLIAQEFDIQHEEFKKDIEHVHFMEHDLFSNIRGEDERSETGFENPKMVMSDDLGSHKTGQRLSAWLKIFEKDPVAPDEFGSGLFLTSSPAVLEHIMEICPENEPVLSTGPIPIGHQDIRKITPFQEILTENLRRLSKSPLEKDLVPLPELTPTSNAHAGLKLFFFPKKSSFAFFKETATQQNDISANNGILNFQKIFIGIVNCPDP